MKAHFHRLVILSLLTSGAVLGSTQFERVKYRFVPIFAPVSGGTVAPYRLSLFNPGGPIRGKLVLQSNSERHSESIELPAGSTSLYGFPYGSEQVKGGLETNEGFIPILENGLDQGYGNNITTRIAVVSDEQVLARSLSVETPLDVAQPPSNGADAQAARVVVGVAAPNMAPSSVSEWPFNAAIVLGKGAEHMSDQSVQSLLDRVQIGSRIVVFRDELPLISADARFKSLLPATLGPVKEVNTQVLDAKITPGSLHFTTLTPIQNCDATKAKDGTITSVSRALGSGLVTFIAFNPDDSALLGSEVALRVVSSLIHRRHDSGDESEMAYGEGPAPSQQDAARFDNLSKNLKAPDGDAVAAILIGYMICVIPANLLLLRALKRPELAWVTSPLIAAGACGVVLSGSRELYSAPNASETTGQMVLSDSREAGLFYGSSQVFYPIAGNYPVEAKDAVTLAAATQVQMASQNLRLTPDQTPVISVPNLAFRSYSIQQRVRASDWMKVEPIDPMSANVSNLSGYPMTNVRVGHGEAVTLQPGESKVLRASANISPKVRHNGIHKTLNVFATVRGMNEIGVKAVKFSSDSAVRIVFVTNMPNGELN